MKQYSLYLSAVQRDLYELVDAQEAFFADQVGYARAIDQLSFNPSPGVRIELSDVRDGAWSATATHSELPSVQCSIAVGA